MKYYVYTHTLDGEIFYVGKGCRSRAREFSRRSALWHEVVGANIHLVKVNVVKWFDVDANAFEETLISRLKELGLQSKYQHWSETYA